MNTFSLEAPVPTSPEFVFSGDGLSNARLEYIAFHGGLVAVQHDIQVVPDEPPLSAVEEIALGMTGVGMGRKEISNALFKSETTVATQLARSYKKLGVTVRGHQARAAAVNRAFESDVFDVRFDITSEEEMLDPYLLKHLAGGGVFDTFVPPNGAPSGYDVAWKKVRAIRRREKLQNVEALIFYAHTAGWLSTKFEIAKAKKENVATS